MLHWLPGFSHFCTLDHSVASATQRKLRIIATTVIPRPGKCHVPLTEDGDWNPAVKSLTKNSFTAHIAKIFPLLAKGKGIWIRYYLPIFPSKNAMPSGQIPNSPYVNCIQLCVLHRVCKHEVWIPHELCLTTALNLQASETWQALHAMVKMFVTEMSISWFQRWEHVISHHYVIWLNTVAPSSQTQPNIN